MWLIYTLEFYSVNKNDDIHEFGRQMNGTRKYAKLGNSDPKEHACYP